MKHYLLGICFAVLFNSGFAAELRVRVVGIVDGDTVKVLTEQHEELRVRLTGIDTPERRQAFGKVAKQTLSSLVYNQTVILQFQKKDRWERILGKLIKDDTDINLKMIQLGLAWHFKRYQAEQSAQDRELYAITEITARANKRGLWVDKEPIPPWNFRRKR